MAPVSVASTTGPKGGVSAHDRPTTTPAAQDGVIATGEFRDLLAARNALASVAPGFATDSQNGSANSAAGEFAAVALLRSAPLPDGKTAKLGAPSAVGSAASDDDLSIYGSQRAGSTDTTAERPRLGSDPENAAPVWLEGETLLPLAAVAAGTGSSGEGPARVVLSSSLQATAAIEIEAGIAEPQLGRDEPCEAGDPAPTATRQTPRERTQAGAFRINLAADSKTASVTGRVAGLAPGEADELERRIRDELAAARLEAKVIRINGRRTPAIGRA